MTPNTRRRQKQLDLLSVLGRRWLGQLTGNAYAKKVVYYTLLQGCVVGGTYPEQPWCVLNAAVLPEVS